MRRKGRQSREGTAGLASRTVLILILSLDVGWPLHATTTPTRHLTHLHTARFAVARPALTPLLLHTVSHVSRRGAGCRQRAPTALLLPPSLRAAAGQRAERRASGPASAHGGLARGVWVNTHWVPAGQRAERRAAGPASAHGGLALGVWVNTHWVPAGQRVERRATGPAACGLALGVCTRGCV